MMSLKSILVLIDFAETSMRALDYAVDRGIPRALLRSVAQDVIRSSSVPVLTFHGMREAA